MYLPSIYLSVYPCFHHVCIVVCVFAFFVTVLPHCVHENTKSTKAHWVWPFILSPNVCLFVYCQFIFRFSCYCFLGLFGERDVGIRQRSTLRQRRKRFGRRFRAALATAPAPGGPGTLCIDIFKIALEWASTDCCRTGTWCNHHRFFVEAPRYLNV